MKSDGDLVFNVWTNGDPTVGMYGCRATVIFHYVNLDSPADKTFLKQATQDMFDSSNVFDDGKVHVATDAELKSEGEE